MNHINTVKISFGDCDPAGIVYYPNTFRWMDATFHDFLRDFGGHTAICAQLGSKGLGLVDASAQFRSPMMDGDELAVHLSIQTWGGKTVTLEYEGRVGERLAFSGREIRCVFKQTETGMGAGDMAELKALLTEERRGEPPRR